MKGAEGREKRRAIRVGLHPMFEIVKSTLTIMSCLKKSQAPRGAMYKVKGQSRIMSPKPNHVWLHHKFGDAFVPRYINF